MFLGNVNGSLFVDENGSSIDANVPGVGQAMAVIAFSDASATPILSGNTIGVGGIGSGSGDAVVRDGALA